MPMPMPMRMPKVSNAQGIYISVVSIPPADLALLPLLLSLSPVDVVLLSVEAMPVHFSELDPGAVE